MTEDEGKNQKLAGKSVTMSVRISQNDALFLAQYKAEGAITPSDKLRSIIRDARENQQRFDDFRGSINLFKKLLEPVDASIREAELEHRVHSELVTRILEWLPDMMASTVILEKQLGQNPDQERLQSLEDGLADRVFRLITSVLQMGVTEKNPCYRKDAINSRVEMVLDLAQLIGNRNKNRKGEVS